MKNYKDSKGAVWAFEADGSQDKFIPVGLVLITEAQALAILNPAPTLAQAQAAQIALISAACGAAVIAGLPSSALGASYVYPTRQTDQTNLMAAVIRVGMPQTPANFMTSLALQTSPGVWGMLSHTVAQVQQVGQDIFGPISAMLVKNNSLAGQVMVASTVAAVQNINWS